MTVKAPAQWYDLQASRLRGIVPRGQSSLGTNSLRNTEPRGSCELKGKIMRKILLGLGAVGLFFAATNAQAADVQYVLQTPGVT